MACGFTERDPLSSLIVVDGDLKRLCVKEGLSSHEKKQLKQQLELSRYHLTRDSKCCTLVTWNIGGGAVQARTDIVRNILVLAAGDVVALQRCGWIEPNIIGHVLPEGVRDLYNHIGSVQTTDSERSMTLHNTEHVTAARIAADDVTARRPEDPPEVPLAVEAIRERMLIGLITPIDRDVPRYLFVNIHLRTNQSWEHLATPVFEYMRRYSEAEGIPIILAGDMNIHAQRMTVLPNGWMRLFVEDPWRVNIDEDTGETQHDRTIDIMFYYNPESAGRGAKIRLFDAHMIQTPIGEDGVAIHGVQLEGENRAMLSHYCFTAKVGPIIPV